MCEIEHTFQLFFFFDEISKTVYLEQVTKAHMTFDKKKFLETASVLETIFSDPFTREFLTRLDLINTPYLEVI